MNQNKKPNSSLDLPLGVLEPMSMLPVADLESVRKENKELTQKNIDVLSLAGFESFYDAYRYSVAQNQLEEIVKGGNKDFSKLTPVEQTVVRNGKPTKMKIYVDKNKNQSEDNELDKDPDARNPIGANELSTGYSFGDFNGEATPKKVSELSDEVNLWLGSPIIPSGSDDFLEGRDEEGRLRYLFGFSIKRNYVILNFTMTDGTVSGAWLTAFYELLKLAIDYKLGAKYPDLKTKALYMLSVEYGMEPKGKFLSVDKEVLLDLVGAE